MSDGRAKRVLNQLLAALPHLRRCENADLNELGTAIDASPHTLRRALSILERCGVPPYGGGNNFECAREGNGVSLYSPLEGFERPVRLSMGEAASLIIGLRAVQEFAACGRGAVASALEKLYACLPEMLRLEGRGAVRIEAAERFPGRRERLSGLLAALHRRRRLELEYYCLEIDGLTRRVVEPVRLEWIMGTWFLLGRIPNTRRGMYFRLELVRRVRVLRERTRRRLVVREQWPYARAYQQPVKAVVAPEVLRDWRTRFPWCVLSVGATTKRGTEAVLLARRPGQLTRLVLHHIGKAKVLGPEHMRRAVAEAAQRALERYLPEAKTSKGGPARASAQASLVRAARS